MYRCLFLCLIMLSFLSCAKTPQSKQTGFLHDYSKLSPLASDSNHLVYTQEDANISVYTKLLIPDVQVIPFTQSISPYDRELYTKVSAYCTASYQKIIRKKSANYELVDVGQRGTLVLEVALSIVDGSELNKAKVIAFVKNTHNAKLYEEGKTHLLVEVKTRDAMSNAVLVESMHLIDTVNVRTQGKQIKFSDLQPALDAWLAQLLK